MLQRTVNRTAVGAFGGRMEHSRNQASWCEEDEGPGMLVSPAFWVGGLLSFGAWVGLAAAAGMI